MRYLVITADDFGYSKERNAGIATCFQKGIITNTSLMVNGIAVEDAVELSKEHGIPMGLHFNISEGVPVADSSKSSSIVDNDGIFLSRIEFWDAVKEGRHKKEDVKTEFEAQLKKFETLVGRPPTHVDGHQHVNIAEGVDEVLADIMKERGIKSTRLPLDLIIDTQEWMPSRYMDFFENAMVWTRRSQTVYQGKGIRSSDCFFGLSTMGRDMNVERIKIGLKNAYASVEKDVPNPVCEFMVHTGYRNGEVGGCGIGPDDFSQSEEREHEMAVLADKDLLNFYKQEEIKLVSFNDCWK